MARMKKEQLLLLVHTLDKINTKMGCAAKLDDDVYDLARSAGVQSTTSADEVFGKLRSVLCGGTPEWLLQSELRNRYQGPLENVLEYQQALRLLGCKA